MLLAHVVSKVHVGLRGCLGNKIRNFSLFVTLLSHLLSRVLNS